MKTHTHFLLILIFNLGFIISLKSSEIKWEYQEIIPGGRIDAITYAGNGILLAGTRNPSPGWIFTSYDFGLTWEKSSFLASQETRFGITCLNSDEKGNCYAINESAEFFRSVDYGKTWVKLSRFSFGKNKDGFALSYGLCLTKQGTILVSDTDSDGGSIYRSIDHGNNFIKIASVSDKPLYRFTLLGNSIIINGWKGCVYRSENDGENWELWNNMDTTALYATEYTGATTFVQASASGNIFEGNQGNKGKFVKLATLKGSADDFVYVGFNTLIYTTYTDEKNVYISFDRGKPG
ncbi:MAG: hypothetical protein HC830_01470 [Bacteroidetes bacterium]|nr:hypothetical protein [Bacteroidota bacterium]